MQPGMTPAERGLPSPADPVARIQTELVARLGAERYQLWCEGKITLTVAGERLTVGVGSPFLLNWMQRQFREVMSDAAQIVLGPASQVTFEVDARTSLGSSTPSVSTELAPLAEDETRPTLIIASEKVKPPVHSLGKVQAVRAPEPSRSSKVRRLADLNDFIPGQANQLALVAARQIVSSETVSFNPLYLHGSVGIGKTHLLEGICRELRRDSSRQNIVLLTAEAFANYFTQALRDHTLPGFRQRFRSADVLLVDDIDFFEGKRVIQEEFLHTVADLMDHGRPVVLAGDRHPRLLTKLSPELTTRIVAGMVCRLEAPDVEARRQIVAAKVRRNSMPISDEALDYVAQRFQANVRELEGALNCLQTYGEMLHQTVTAAQARDILCDLERDCLKFIKLADIERAVCSFFGLTGRELKSESRSRSVSQPRMLAMYLARKHTSTPYSEIGQHFGGRNHSTVMSAERKVQDWIKSNTAVHVAASAWTIQDVLGSLEQQLLAG
jgi:chromosomal replication initiator protein